MNLNSRMIGGSSKASEEQDSAGNDQLEGGADSDILVGGEGELRPAQYDRCSSALAESQGWWREAA